MKPRALARAVYTYIYTMRKMRAGGGQAAGAAGGGARRDNCDVMYCFRPAAR